ncbi:hypothetical protein DUZ99_02170 [Xylanibacillus composti]|uniref:Uncharacterized protein n=1 Tax=Xylanibacillus composti TaxID=1572762 RepID=A0A8J4H0N7_9BACL|nr:hypothetical protein [Xylanibacillus composti]MDT9723801.1 hypothetical protein [Xylanibacillus composti]GIQ67426.1 hypothetical protein XYCOK13_02500 [Xylanibacillus composti]
MAQVDFKATFDGLNLASKNKVTLVLPENTSDFILGKLVRMKGQELFVSFEDPQQELNLDERPERRVMTYTTDRSGVVEGITTEGEQMEFPTEPGAGSDDPDRDLEKSGEDDSDDTIELDDDAADGDVRKDQLSDWEQAIMNGEDPAAKHDTREADLSTVEEINLTEIPKEDLEQFILQERPGFPDIEIDFPALLERKRSGETWMNIANAEGLSSGQLSSKWTAYKKLVAKMMRDGGAA